MDWPPWGFVVLSCNITFLVNIILLLNLVYVNPLCILKFMLLRCEQGYFQPKDVCNILTFPEQAGIPSVKAHCEPSYYQAIHPDLFC